MHGDLAPEIIQLVALPVDSTRPKTPILPRRHLRNCGHSSRPTPFVTESTATRRSVMFSPILRWCLPALPQWFAHPPCAP